MKAINVIIFFTIALSILGAVNFYICIRGWQALPKEPLVRIPYLVIFVFLAVSYIAGRVLERFAICEFSNCLIWIGSFWLGLMLYLFLGVLLCDLLRLANWITGIVPVPSGRYVLAKQIAAAAVALTALIAILTGFYNTLHPRINNITIEIPKSAGGRKSLDIALVTDVHMGTIIKNAHLQKMVDMVNVIRPDVVLLCGDIVDEDLAPVIKNNLGELLGTIRSRFGTFAVTGNHEYIGGVEAACRYLGAHGVTMLRDRAVLIGGTVYIAGREDRSIGQFVGRGRMPIEKLLEQVDVARPVILMDHQPFGLSGVAGRGVDLHVSGHTHHGQLWPINYITSKIFEVSRGHRLINGTNFYVSCGFGTWGPPARIGAVPEVVHIQLRFRK